MRADVVFASRVVAPRSRARTAPLRRSTNSSVTLSRTAVSSEGEGLADHGREVLNGEV
jgi:hypothetical protein